MRNRETEIAQIIVIIILLIGLLFVIPVAKKEKETNKALYKRVIDCYLNSEY